MMCDEDDKSRQDKSCDDDVDDDYDDDVDDDDALDEDGVYHECHFRRNLINVLIDVDCVVSIV